MSRITFGDAALCRSCHGTGVVPADIADFDRAIAETLNRETIAKSPPCPECHGLGVISAQDADVARVTVDLGNDIEYRG